MAKERTVEVVEQEILVVKGQVFDILEQIDLHSNSIAAYEKKKIDRLRLRKNLEDELAMLKNKKQ